MEFQAAPASLALKEPASELHGHRAGTAPTALSPRSLLEAATQLPQSNHPGTSVQESSGLRVAGGRGEAEEGTHSASKSCLPVVIESARDGIPQTLLGLSVLCFQQRPSDFVREELKRAGYLLPPPRLPNRPPLCLLSAGKLRGSAVKERQAVPLGPLGQAGTRGPGRARSDVCQSFSGHFSTSAHS